MMQMFMNMMKPQHYTNNPYTMITEMNDPIYQAISDPEQQQQYLENQTQDAIQTEVQKVQTNPSFSSLTIDEQAQAKEYATYDAIVKKQLSDNGYKMQGTKNGNKLSEPVYINNELYIISYKNALTKKRDQLDAQIQANDDEINDPTTKARVKKTKEAENLILRAEFNKAEKLLVNTDKKVDQFKLYLSSRK